MKKHKMFYKQYTITTATEELKISLSELVMKFRDFLRSNESDYNIANSYRIVELFLKNKFEGNIDSNLELMCLKEDLRPVKWVIINEQVDAK